MTCFFVFIVVGVLFSFFLHPSNGDFFRKYGLIQPAHLDARFVEKLERRYRKCVAKLNSGRNTKTEEIPENSDILSHVGLWYSNDPPHSKSVRLWPNNVIPTEFHESVTKMFFEKRLECAMLYFLAKTCIRFQEKQKNDTNYLVISNEGPLCSSDSVGMKGGKQTVNLGGSIDSDCWKHGTVVHELLHVIGMFHEHQRDDRDEHIDINFDYISPMLMPQFDTVEEMGYEDYDDIGKYDFSSIMHYPSKDKRDEHKLIMAKQSKYKFEALDLTEQMGNREQPTDMDTLKVKELYQCDPVTTTLTNRSIRVLAIGGWGNESSMEYYYPYQSRYNSLINATMIIPRRYHTSVVMKDGKIMTMGGWDGYHFLKHVEILDPITNTSTNGTKMNKARSQCDSAIINGVVYVCGGLNDDNRMSSCECYQSGVWEDIAPMHKARDALRLISLDGYLYAIGGYQRNNVLNSVEKYNPKLNSWMMVQPMQSPRDSHGAVVLNGFIYVCDGMYRHSCERYEPALDKWSNIAKTIVDRGEGLRMVSDGHHLFAFGGIGSYPGSSAEMYEPKKDKWILLKKPLIHKRLHSSVVVPH